MEHKFQHSRNFSEPDKQVILNLGTNSVTTRKKLVEKGFQKDKIPSKPRNFSNSRKSERFSLPTPYFTQTKVQMIQKPEHKRTQSMEKSAKKIFNTSEQVKNFQNRKKQEKPTDCILRVAEKLSVKKINVRTI